MSGPRSRLLVLAVLLAGCTGPNPGGTGPATAASTTVVGAGPTASATSGTLGAPMPAADGRPMLWPTTSTSGPVANPTVLHGFVDVHGRLVVPARYERYLFCPDETGRAAFVIASRAGRPDDLLDLNGTVLRRTPTSHSSCAGTDHVVVTRVIDGELGKIDSGVMRIATGELVVPWAKNRRIQAIDTHTVNVSDPVGEYFLDLGTGRRTPHPGWLVDQSLGDQPKLLPAAGGANRPDQGRPARVGVLDRAGHWLAPPTYAEVSGFLGGRAVVRSSEGFGFLDTTLRRVGGTWDDLWTVIVPRGNGDHVLGYVASTGNRQALLDAHLTTLVPPGGSRITCDWRASGWCGVVTDGRTTAWSLADGASRPTPSGFDKVLGPGFDADGTDQDGPSQRLHVVATGADLDLPAPAVCAQVGDWARCTTAAGVVQTLVFDASGQRRDVAGVEAVPDPSGSGATAYYWVTAGQYQGFVDADGAWHYRESRYTTLED